MTPGTHVHGGTHHVHGWAELSVRELVVFVGADGDERGDVAVVRAADTHTSNTAAAAALGAEPLTFPG